MVSQSVIASRDAVSIVRIKQFAYRLCHLIKYVFPGIHQALRQSQSRHSRVSVSSITTTYPASPQSCQYSRRKVSAVSRVYRDNIICNYRFVIRDGDTKRSSTLWPCHIMIMYILFTDQRRKSEFQKSTEHLLKSVIVIICLKLYYRLRIRTVGIWDFLQSASADMMVKPVQSVESYVSAF